ncbi:MAG: MATE family efflux transporter [Lachnospiraceae bacterium]|nr:MATE family efflux transporter [Lachnospiraceae bacterium]
MTEGSIAKHLLLFFVPLLAGTFFQLLYNTVDALIVGRFVGTEALSAVGGSASQLVNMFVGLFVGVSGGATVVVAQAFGARRDDDLKKAVQTSIGAGFLFGCILTVLFFLLTPVLLTRMHTEELAMSQLYLRIYTIGMLPNVLYNVSSGIFRAVGDSGKPFWFLVAGALTNIVLDLVFVIGLGTGVAGVAAATVISQLLSAALSLHALMHADGAYRLELGSLRLDPWYTKRIVGIGIPSGIQNMMYSTSNVIVQAAINTLGITAIAAWAVLAKIDALYWMLVSSLGISITTFVGQNYGAGRLDRVKKSMAVAAGVALAGTAAFSVFMYSLAPQLYGIFTEDAAVIEMGTPVARIFAASYVLYIGLEVFSATLRGMGDTLRPTLIMLVGICLLRIAFTLYAAPRHRSLIAISFGYPLTWLVTSILFAFYFVWFIRKLHNKKKASGL